MSAAPGLRGAVVALTGASSGIGRESALAFAREGACLALAARRADRLHGVAEEARALGAEVLTAVTDVAERGQVFQFVEGAVARFGRLDVMVNNAGYGVRGRVEDVRPDAYERLMRVNYLGTVWGCQAVVPIMRKQGSGVIINVSSIVGHRALPTGGAYGATKAAQISLTEALRAELAGTGVAVSSIHPIGTASEFGEVQARESGDAGGLPLGPQQTSREVAEAIVRCAKRPRAEVYPSPLSRLLVALNAISPALVDRLAVRAARKAGRL